MLTIKYRSSVYVAAGWRSIAIMAEADRISPKMAQVTKIISIDGEAPDYGMSRTGARRQEYNGHSVAQREIGARKRISTCTIVDEVAA
jgi:hypothetical protein